jgi:hypothetical protein
MLLPVVQQQLLLFLLLMFLLAQLQAGCGAGTRGN